MNSEEREAFVSRPLTAVLSTISKDGRIHAVPVWYLYEGGVFKVLTDRGSAKHRNIERTGQASLCVDERDGAFQYVSVEGPVVVAPEVTREQRLALHTHYRGAEQAERIVARGGHERMVLLALTPQRWLG